MGRIPPEAFRYYVELGADRSYQSVADHYGTSKATVVQAARRGRWQERLDELRAAELRAIDDRVLAIWDEKIEQYSHELSRRTGERVDAILAMPTRTATQVIHQMMAVIREERRLLGLSPTLRPRA